jgi:hypothetical protein
MYVHVFSFLYLMYVHVRLYFSKPDIEISGGSGKKNWTDRDKDCMSGRIMKRFAAIEFKRK